MDTNLGRDSELHSKIREARDLAKEQAENVTDPKAAALCETTYEVLAGLETAFDHYAAKSEKAWK